MGNKSLRAVKIQHYENLKNNTTEMNKKALITLLVQLSTMHIKDTPGEVNREEKHFFFFLNSCKK